MLPYLTFQYSLHCLFPVNLDIVMYRKFQTGNRKKAASVHLIRTSLVGIHGHFYIQWQQTTPSPLHRCSVKIWHLLFVFSQSFIPVNLVPQVCVMS